MKIPTPAVEQRRGIRSKITDFSAGSRRTFLAKLNTLDQGKLRADRIGLLTLTYGKQFPSPRAAKDDHLKAFLRKLQDEWGRIPLFWKLEPQKRGAPHFHLLIFADNADQLRQLGPWAARTWHEIAGAGEPWHLQWHLGRVGNKPCLEPIRSWNGVRAYGAKYIGKLVDGQHFAGWEHPGRWWGNRFYDHLPRRVRAVELSQAKVKLARRLMRRWYQKQPSGRWRVIDNAGRVHRLHLRPQALADFRTAGFELRPIYRKWSSCRGGMTLYAPDRLGRQILTWLGEVHADDDDEAQRVEHRTENPLLPDSS